MHKLQCLIANKLCTVFVARDLRLNLLATATRVSLALQKDKEVLSCINYNVLLLTSFVLYRHDGENHAYKLLHFF